MSVPMVDREELVGVLNVSAPPSGRFSDDDMQTLAAFAEQAAAAIAKARLYESSRRMSDDLAHRATHDSLTGLPNRALLRGRVAASLEREPVEGSLLFVDLDGFKRVNDRLGHAAGDYLLTLTAERMQGACPASALAARIGGDEFAVLVPDGAADEAAAVATSVIDAVGRPVLVDGTTVEVSASVGIALIGVHGSTYPDLMAAADAALYHAKRTGKNRYELADTTAAAASQLPRPRLTSEPGPRGEHVSG
jgi:diguanylate cyclase (GGDEF)-like protein